MLDFEARVVPSANMQSEAFISYTAASQQEASIHLMRQRNALEAVKHPPMSDEQVQIQLSGSNICVGP